ncbi:unnamed protein product [Dibothriocephalus latus]|uniref:Uncharacterized protein n=1 Tax=Dibothriocephalus latus TaxID=60516 RepID=A0A3P7MXA0_DIBLA|nr:unnamed protein product [Dibothriocephalus latus]
MSEFVLPDDTRVAVRRVESSFPSDHTQSVMVCLAVGHPQDTLYTPSESGSITTLDYSGGPTDTDEGPDGSYVRLVTGVLNSSFISPRNLPIRVSNLVT